MPPLLSIYCFSTEFICERIASWLESYLPLCLRCHCLYAFLIFTWHYVRIHQFLRSVLNQISETCGKMKHAHNTITSQDRGRLHPTKQRQRCWAAQLGSSVSPQARTDVTYLSPWNCVNFRGFVLGCIEAKFCKKKYAFESSRRDLHNALLCTACTALQF